MAIRAYREADLKRLFALSHNVCAFPGCDQRIADARWPTVQAEICHIGGLNPGSARHDPELPEERLNAFENLLLLCPNHHRVIDELDPDAWPTERLLELKADHERQRGGDVRIEADLIARAVIALIARDALQVDDLDRVVDDLPDPDGESWIDPSTGVGLIALAVARAGQIEARYFGAATPLNLDQGWVEIGLAANEYFDLLVARALQESVPFEDVAALRHLRNESDTAFGRIPGC